MKIPFLVWAPLLVIICGLIVSANNSPPPQAARPPSQAFTSPPTASAEARLARAVQQQFKVAPKLAEEIVVAARFHAKQEALPVSLVLAVIAKESSFNPKAISHGDLGLMQVNSYWHRFAIKQAGGRNALFSVSTNIRIGTRILSQYVRQYGIYEGLRAYNGKGKKNTYPADVLRLQKIFS